MIESPMDFAESIRKEADEKIANRSQSNDWVKETWKFLQQSIRAFHGQKGISVQSVEAGEKREIHVTRNTDFRFFIQVKGDTFWVSQSTDRGVLTFNQEQSDSLKATVRQKLVDILIENP